MWDVKLDSRQVGLYALFIQIQDGIAQNCTCNEESIWNQYAIFCEQLVKFTRFFAEFHKLSAETKYQNDN